MKILKTTLLGAAFLASSFQGLVAFDASALKLVQATPEEVTGKIQAVSDLKKEITTHFVGLRSQLKDHEGMKKFEALQEDLKKARLELDRANRPGTRMVTPAATVEKIIAENKQKIVDLQRQISEAQEKALKSKNPEATVPNPEGADQRMGDHLRVRGDEMAQQLHKMNLITSGFIKKAFDTQPSGEAGQGPGESKKEGLKTMFTPHDVTTEEGRQAALKAEMEKYNQQADDFAKSATREGM